MEYSEETGLWFGEIGLGSTGLHQLRTEAEDGAGNKTERKLNPILAVAPGKIKDAETRKLVKKGEVSLYVQDPLSKIWALWDGKTFGQENPQKISEDGTYQYFLPPGIYYLQIRSSGYAT